MAICEDAPCCGCCGTNLYGSNENGHYSEPDYVSHDLMDFYEEPDWDECDHCDDGYINPKDGVCGDCGHSYVAEADVMEDQWLDGSYEE